MKIINHSLVLMLLMAVFLLSSCSKEPKSAKLIPADATVVMRFDVEQIAKKSGINDDGKLKAELKKELKSANLPTALHSKVEAIIDDPSKSGIDLRDPLFVYVQSYPTPAGGLVGSIGDAKAFQELINDFSKEMGVEQLQEEEGVRYLINGDADFVFNDDCFAMLWRDTLAGDSKARLAELKKLMKDGVEKSMSGNDFFKQMCEKKGVAQMLVSYGSLMAMPQMVMMTTMMPEGLKMDEIAYLIDFEVEKGESKAIMEILSSSSEWDKQLKKNEEIAREIKGDLLKYMSKDGFALFFNYDGAKLYEYLKSMPFVKQIPQETMTMLQKALTSIDGDGALGISDIDEAADKIDLSFLIQTKDATLVDMCKAFGVVSPEAKETSPGCYAIPLGWDADGKQSLNLGYKNKISFVTLGMPGQNFAAASHPFTLQDVKGRRCYLRFDFKLLNKIAQKGNTSDKIAMREVAKMFDYVEGYDEGARKFVVRLVNKDKTKNVFELLYACINSFANVIQSNTGDVDSYDVPLVGADTTTVDKI